MKLVILAGGLGTRISEETKKKPKPMVKIGNMPIIWHIMKIYSSYGIKDFIICLGYKGHVIKEFLSKRSKIEKWNINFVNTGLKTLTGGRIKRIEKFINKNENFCMTYGDGLSNINIKKLIKFHFKHKKIATVSAVNPPSRFGVLTINKNKLVTNFREKPSNSFINGGFFVLSKKVFKFLKNDKTIFEVDCLTKLFKNKELKAFKHVNFWACMDTVKDKNDLNKLWKKSNPPWKVW